MEILNLKRTETLVELIKKEARIKSVHDHDAFINAAAVTAIAA